LGQGAGGLDLDPRARLDQARHADERHRRVVLAEARAPRGADLARRGPVRGEIGDVDRHLGHALRRAARGPHDGEDVVERPRELLREAVALELLPLVPPDLTGDEERPARDDRAVRVTPRPRPPRNVDEIDLAHDITCPPSIAIACPWTLLAPSAQSIATT